MLKNLSVHMLNGLFLWCFQVTSPWKQISGQVELMKEPETQKGLQRGYSLFWEPISGLKKKKSKSQLQESLICPLARCVHIR